MIPSMPCSSADSGGPGRPALLVLSLVVLTLLCRQAGLQAGGDSKPFPVQFRNVTRQAGLTFQHNNGAFGKSTSPKPWDREPPSWTTTTTTGRTFC